MSGHTVPCCRYSKLAIERPRSGNEGGNQREREREKTKTKAFLGPVFETKTFNPCDFETKSFSHHRLVSYQIL